MAAGVLSIRDARTPEQIRSARELFVEYAGSVGIDLCFQGFDEELATLPGCYAPPPGRLLLAVDGEAVAGCIALRRLEAGVCEMKRLYVRPRFRSRGVGRLLAERLIREAGIAGYQWMRLDSLPSMTAARALYRRLGFRDIASYRENPIEGAVFLELQLDGRPQ